MTTNAKGTMSPKDEIISDGVVPSDEPSTKNSSSFLMKNSTKLAMVELKLEGVSYTPITSSASKAAQKGKDNRTTVLSDVSTTISPYKLTAWMGPSGSGKTSLTSVVAGLVDSLDVSRGVLKVNGEEGRLPKKMVGVVWQDDLLLSSLSVEETIYFAARLKSPSGTSEDEVKMLVEEIMKELGLLHIRNNMIGSPLVNVPGISGGERKRTAVAAELVIRPPLLLLDEPTSGLDATTARALMTTLKSLAGLGHSISVVIHQPRTDIFKMLDHILLLSKGRVVYDGPACAARSYLETCPTVEPLPPETGIADWISDTIMADERSEDNPVLADNWAERQRALKAIDGARDGQTKQRTLPRQMSTLTELQQSTSKFEASFSTQLRLLLQRTIKQRRLEKITRVSILLTLTYLCFTSLFWWRLPDTTAYIFERNSLLFFILIAQGNSIVTGSITVFQRDRALLHRDRAKKMYGIFPYFLAKVASDMTNNVFLPSIYGAIVYFTVGLRFEFVAFLKYMLAFYLTLVCAQSMGFFLGVLIPQMNMALLLAPAVTLFQFILGGFYIPLSNLHVGIKWASYVSFARYGYSALVMNEFAGREIPCADGDVPISIGGSSECPLPGDVVVESMGIEGIFTYYWFNIGVLAALQVFFLIGAYGLLRKSN
jgi:ABC-type multidrug transport system ATPase subunit/ABC-type multidrug transport system permease subunit